jgi:hypothetical protein
LKGLSLHYVTTIGKEAFEGDIALDENIPIEIESVTSIGEGAFKGCTSIKDVRAEKVREIQKSAFENCTSLVGLSTGEELITIGEGAFKGCTSIERMDLEQITNIGEECFKGCSKLELIRVPSTINVPENITDNENTVIGYVYNNITYKINKDGETVIALDGGEQELPKTVIINNKTYRVVKELSSISVTTPPEKTSYFEGDNFDKTGMVVTATYNDGTTKVITEYSVTDGSNLAVEKTSVTISYTENEVTKTTEVEGITVIKKEKLTVKFESYTTEEEDNVKYLEKILPETSIKNFKKDITTNGKTLEIYIGNEKITDDSMLIGTGMEIVIKLNDEEERYTVVVTGDLIGNGKIGIGDLSRLSRYATGLDKTLNGAYLKASDVVKDGNYGKISDILKISRIMAGMDNL